MGDEQPRRAAGRGDRVRLGLLRQGPRRGWPALLPITADLGLRKAWAATIDFTPDHLPILGPALTADGPVAGTVVAAAGGHGMMWGPGVSKAAADLAVARRTDVLDVTDLGLDRFDEHGRSRLAPDPIALPVPRSADLAHWSCMCDRLPCGETDGRPRTDAIARSRVHGGAIAGQRRGAARASTRARRPGRRSAG